MPASLEAQTILQQLGGTRFIAMTGAKQFVGSHTMLMFSLPASLTTGKANKCRITLNALDLYDIELLRITKKLECIEVAKETDVYCEDLQRTFTAMTGLYTTL